MVSASTLLGAAGEHYVMSLLLRRGFIAALAPVGVPNCDIVVTDDIGDRLCAVQVKTRVDKGSDGGWHMSRKHEAIQSPSLFYAFVDFGKSLATPPACFIVPSEVVADVIKRSHQAWLMAPGAKGQVRNDTEFRRFLPDYERKGLMIGCGADLAPKFYPVLSSLQRFWVAVFGAVAAGCGAEPFRLRSTASRRGLIV